MRPLIRVPRTLTRANLLFHNIKYYGYQKLCKQITKNDLIKNCTNKCIYSTENKKYVKRIVMHLSFADLSYLFLPFSFWSLLRQVRIEASVCEGVDHSVASNGGARGGFALRE